MIIAAIIIWKKNMQSLCWLLLISRWSINIIINIIFLYFKMNNNIIVNAFKCDFNLYKVLQHQTICFKEHFPTEQQLWCPFQFLDKNLFRNWQAIIIIIQVFFFFFPSICSFYMIISNFIHMLEQFFFFF